MLSEATQSTALLAETGPSTPPLPVLAAVAAVDRHPAAVYVARLGPGSRRTMRQALDRIADLVVPGSDAVSLPWAQLRYPHTQAVRAKLAELYSPATANKALSALRGVLREAWQLGQMSAEELARAVDLEAVKGSTVPTGRGLNAGEIRALCDACVADPTPAGARDAALLALLAAGGLRRAEAVALDLDDVDASTGAVTVRSGKGRKARSVYLTNGALAALGDWLNVRGDESGPLLLPMRKGSRLLLRRLTAQAVYVALAKRAREANVAPFSPHDLRRSFCGDLLDAGVDTFVVQQLMGHSSSTTTIRYDRRSERVKRNAAERLHFPYTQA